MDPLSEEAVGSGSEDCGVPSLGPLLSLAEAAASVASSVVRLHLQREEGKRDG